MIVRAFTGPSTLTEEQIDVIWDHALALPQPDVARTGLAYGVDSVVAECMYREYHDTKHSLFRPAAPHNDKLLAWLTSGALPNRKVEVIDCPAREDRASAYRRRNEMMVHNATELVAYVRESEFYRSGEWMTINIARKEGMPVTIYKI
jgi:hypothetical protein